MEAEAMARKWHFSKPTPEAYDELDRNDSNRKQLDRSGNIRAARFDLQEMPIDILESQHGRGRDRLPILMLRFRMEQKLGSSEQEAESTVTGTRALSALRQGSGQNFLSESGAYDQAVLKQGIMRMTSGLIDWSAWLETHMKDKRVRWWERTRRCEKLEYVVEYS